MKRSGTFIILLFFLSLAAAYIAGAAATPIKGSKHDLSYRTTNTVPIMSDSGGTTEICVFCHTPHHSRTDAPLWNRTNSAQSYQTYTSDVLAGLGYPGPESPSDTGASGYAVHVKTRICLSCHDGTIALGKLVNSPLGMGVDIPMVGVGNPLEPGGMPYTAQGYIGTNLRDDHPVAVKLQSGPPPGFDPELLVPAASSKVSLYNLSVQKNNSNGNYVECTSCHNAHDNQYGNFLVMSNAQSAICTTCHNKTGFASPSSHATSTVAYSPDGGSKGTTVGGTTTGVLCMDCHFPHKASTPSGQNPAIDTNAKAGYYLLSLSEEQSCYNNPDRWNSGANACHGTSGAGKDIQSEVSGALKVSKHDVSTSSSKHEAYEARISGWVGSLPGNWHVECADCHNPHTAGTTNHTSSPGRGTINGNTVGSSSPLYGTGGTLKPSTPPTWPASYVDTNPPTGSWSSTYIEPIGVLRTSGINLGVTHEYEICYKCHTDFAWNNTPPDSPSLGAGKKMTNQALEFQTTNNLSYHPIEGQTNRNSGVTLVPPWNTNKGTQTMYCSDCHTKETDGSPSGPHGSTISNPGGGPNALLRTAYTTTYSTTKTAQQPAGELCAQCHPDTVYNTAGTGDGTSGTNFWTGSVNLHNRHATIATNLVSTFAYRCVNCHVRIPHGYKNRGMVVVRNDGFPYEAGATGLGKITSYSPPAGNWSGTKGPECLTVNGCHQ